MKPLIGIATNLDENRLGMAINSLPTYSTAIEKAGDLPLILPFNTDQALLSLMVEKVDGLLFPDGIDLDPVWYNEKPAAGREVLKQRSTTIWQSILRIEWIPSS